MDFLINTTDYLMDFNKVRKFQDICGLKEDLTSNTKEDSHNDIKKGTKYEDKVHTKTTLKHKVGNNFLHQLFLLGSVLGTEIFYITFFPFVIWNIDDYIARKTIIVWVVTMYIGQAAKDLLKWPRPTSPPVFKLEERVAAEYGLPSTHAIAGTSVPFTIFIASIGRFDYPLIIGCVLAIMWSLLVSLSRLYVGMHSIMDILGGISISLVYLVFARPFMDMVDDYTLHSTFAPYIIILSHYLLALFYPNTDHGSTTRADTAVILGVGAGILSGAWVNQQYGLNIKYEVLPMAISVPSFTTAVISFCRFFAGVAILFGIKLIAKKIAIYIVSQIITKEDPEKDQKTVPIKFITYSSVGFIAVCVCPILMSSVGLDF